MRVLGLETATRIASVGIHERGRGLAERTLPMSGDHARAILPLIGEALVAAGVTMAELDLVAVSIGPGSFTGLRIGLSVAKGLALASGLAIVGVPTLEAYAHTVGPRSGTVWPVLDARKGEVYAAGFRWRDGVIDCVAPPQAMTPRALAARIEPPCVLVGDGFDAHADLGERRLGGLIERIGLESLPPSGLIVARLGADRFRSRGADDLTALEPSYCRISAAETLRERPAPDAGG